MTNTPPDVRRMQALARIQEDQPEYTREILHDSGYGALAEDWWQARQEFSRAADRAVGLDDEAAPDTAATAAQLTRVLRAYAQRCVTWARISQLRDQARRSMDVPFS